jgi:hypothetical protein
MSRPKLTFRQVMVCQDPVRRSLLLTALAAGTYLAVKPVAAEEDQPGSDERPQKGDFLVLSEGENAGEVIKPSDLKLRGPPVHAWPKDPKTSVIRKGSRLNEIVLIKFDPGELDEDSRSRSGRRHRRLFADLHSRRMSRLGVGEGSRRRQEHSEMPLSQLRIQSPRKRASCLWAGTPASGGASASDR